MPFTPFSVLLCARSHYTGHFKAVVTKHQNVFVMKDIMANGYRAGGNTKFFGTSDDDVKSAMMKRLNMDDTNGDEEMCSLLAFPMPFSQYENGNMDIAMSVTSRFLPYEVAGSSRQHNSFPGGEEMFKAYNTAFGLRAVHFGEDLRASENMEYMSQVNLLFPTRTVDAKSMTWETPSTPCCASLSLRAGLDQQLALLHGPAP